MRIQAMIGAAVIGIGLAAIGQDDVVPPKQESTTRVRVSEGVMKGLLIKKVAPEYPREAREKHITGSVEMKAIISQEGDVQKLIILSGDPLLVHSAVEAAKQWKYKPYLQHGQPVEVETQIKVIFSGN
jgi:periplasmic protein TonB